MDFVKKNLVSLICGTIALVAIIATFFPLSGYFTELNKKLAQRTTEIAKINGLLKKPRTLARHRP